MKTFVFLPRFVRHFPPEQYQSSCTVNGRKHSLKKQNTEHWLTISIYFTMNPDWPAWVSKSHGITVFIPSERAQGHGAPAQCSNTKYMLQGHSAVYTKTWRPWAERLGRKPGRGRHRVSSAYSTSYIHQHTETTLSMEIEGQFTASIHGFSSPFGNRMRWRNWWGSVED